ncbi:alpha CA [Emiliania huxleyi CCMP1516]|uniref:carbonic anhydrase n=2 Tax=Emiliania huxleyi TaxID=2903 RepID=A0A0D3KV70_EMIH1|nr:alpha CA [Emiliania huxleyi CCMP1516]EOD39655.1 alpha CA [Emiliania huxleyi CCMP1516]|eukprot:XP_005792084.1 alpha CA [Emiliania huxleyi CCMP1516]
MLPAGATPATAPVENGSASKGYTVLHGRRYDFYQVHWHTPSEHLVDGRHAALEAHFVHRDASESGLAVITVLYDEAAACDPLLSAFWDDFPPSDGARRYAESAASVDFGAMLSELLLRGGGAYQWEGSLTTPPCTEGVEWRLIKARRHVCAAQLERLRAALGAASGVRANNRMVQPLNGRLLRASALSPPAAPFPLWGAAAVGGVLALALAAALAFAARRGRGGARRSRAGLLQARGPSTGEKELSSALPSAGSRTPAVPGAASAGGHADDSGLRNSSSSSDSFVSEDADSAGELLAREKV